MNPPDFDFKFIIGEAQAQLSKRAMDLISLVREEKIDTLLFLDRSARPASWIFESFWKRKYSDAKLPDFVFINTGKKDLSKIVLDDKTKESIKHDLGFDSEKKLSGKNVLIVDDINSSGKQKEFVENVLAEIFKPKSVAYFEWNKLGGMRLPHGLSYVDDGSFSSTNDPEKVEIVKRIKLEIKILAKID